MREREKEGKGNVMIPRSRLSVIANATKINNEINDSRSGNCFGFCSATVLLCSHPGYPFFPPAIVADSHPFRQKRAIPATTRLEIY